MKNVSIINTNKLEIIVIIDVAVKTFVKKSFSSVDLSANQHLIDLLNVRM